MIRTMVVGASLFSVLILSSADASAGTCSELKSLRDVTDCLNTAVDTVAASASNLADDLASLESRVGDVESRVGDVEQGLGTLEGDAVTHLQIVRKTEDWPIGALSSRQEQICCPSGTTVLNGRAYGTGTPSYLWIFLEHRFYGVSDDNRCMSFMFVNGTTEGIQQVRTFAWCVNN